MAPVVVSQSLLHQVCGWNEGADLKGADLKVSIPSSSGLRLEYHPATYQTRHVGLNPFFIRSAVGIDHGTVAANVSGVSIPSSSGLRLESRKASKLAKQVCLNPFFIRSAVGIKALAKYFPDTVSQSLLHQVCGWNMSPDVIYGPEYESQSLLHQVCGWNMPKS